MKPLILTTMLLTLSAFLRLTPAAGPPPRAAQSVRATLAVPQPFGTFPGIAQRAASLAAELRQLKISFYEMKPGETISFRGREFVRN